MLRIRTSLFRAQILAPVLVASATLVSAQSLAEVAGEEAETLSQPAAPSAGPPIAGLDAILSRIPGASQATAGSGIRVADIESSIIHTADEESERGRQLRREILGHEAIVHATILETVPGAIIVPTSFLDSEDDVVRHARETGADMVVLALGEPARAQKKGKAETPTEKGRLEWPDLDIRLRSGETPESLYLYAKTLQEEPDTLFVTSIGNDGRAITRHDLPWHISAIPNGVAAVWVDENERIHPLSDRCGPAWQSHMCIAVFGSMQLTDGAGAPYREDGTVVHGTSIAAARLAAGLAVLKQWLREVEGRKVSPEQLLQIACNTARLGPNSHREVGCGILDLDSASRGHAWAETTRFVTPTLKPPPSRFGDRNRFLPDGSVAIEGAGFDTLNAFGDGLAAEGVLTIYDRLALTTFDKFRGLIAESVTVDDEEGWVEFVLREEARWHDGAPITADDVVWTAETLTANGPHWLVDHLFEGVERVVERGPRTVRFIYGTVRPDGLIAVPRLGWMPILPKHFWRGRDFRSPIMEPPLGSGRYHIAAVDPDGRWITYEPVEEEDYWARNLEVHGDRPSAEPITYRYVESVTSSEDQN